MDPSLRDSLENALGESYSIERELGGGGMSRVFVAEDRSLGRKVVVKVLPPEMAAGVSIDRFKREIALAARLQHPHIVPLFSASDVNGLPYFTMPFVEGESLRARIAKKGELPLNDAVRVLREVASALDYAHEKGVVHRDIKPDNVLLSRGSAMVTDFGVAKALSASSNAEDSGMTSLGVALGTPAYMAPEQATADPQTDHRADIYAFGVLAYEILTGQPPFAGRTPQGLLAAHVTESPELITRRRTGIPAPLATLVMRCLEKRPADRPQSAQDIVHALDAINTPSGGMQPTTAQPAITNVSPSAAEPVMVARRVPVVAILGGVAAIGLLGWLGWRSTRGATKAEAASVAPERVVVASFVNKSGDPSLAPVGDMAADWIARGLAGTGIVDVAGTGAELQSVGGVKLAQGSAAIEQLGREARAGIVISGAYYKQGDSLLLQADFTDVKQGKLLQSVGPVATSVARPLDGIELLRQRVTGALAPIIDSTLSGVAQHVARPPSYEAYQQFLRAEQLYYADEPAAVGAFRRAIALDTTYLYPQLRLLLLLSNMRQLPAMDSLTKKLEPKRALMTPYESAFFDFGQASLHSTDPRLVFDATSRLMAAAPTAAFPKYLHATSLNGMGQPKAALTVLESLDPRSGALRGRIFFHQYVFVALHALGEHERALASMVQARAQYPDVLLIAATHARALAVLGRTREVMALLDATLAMPEGNRFTHAGTGVLVAAEAFAHDHSELTALATRWSEQQLSRSADPSHTQWVQLYATTGDWAKLGPRAEAAVRAEPTNGMYLSAVAVAAAKTGDVVKARDYAGRLDRAIAADSASTTLAIPNLANKELYRAAVAAALGDLAGATAQLRSRPDGGWSPNLYHNAGPLFVLLRAYPGFQDLLKPKG